VSFDGPLPAVVEGRGLFEEKIEIALGQGKNDLSTALIFMRI